MASNHHAQPFSRRILVAFLSLLMVVSTVPTSAVADAVQARSAEALSAEALEQVLESRMGRTYEVSFDANGGTGEMDPVKVGEEPQALVADDGTDQASEPDPSLYLVEVPESAFTREGFTFTGWSTTPDNEDITETVTPEEGEPYEVVRIYARMVEPGTVLDRFTFSGDADGDGKVAEGEYVDVMDAVADDGHITLYAQWQEVPETVEGESEPGSGETVEISPEVTEDAVALTGDEELVAAPMATFSARTEGDVPASAEGAYVDSVSVEWLGETDADGTMAVQCADATKVSARARARIALSGSTDHAAGTVTVTVPKQIVRDRDGNLVGTMTLAVPKAPSTAATFAYTEEADRYVLTNTRTLSAATQASFEFTVTGIDPLVVAAGSVSDPFQASVRVTLPSGTVVGRDSGSIALRLDTHVALDSATAVADRLGVTDTSFVPEDLRLDGDWVYASFRTYAHTAGSEPYNLSLCVSDTSCVAGARILGGSERTVGTSMTDFGNVGTQTVYVAYPASSLPEGGTYDLSVAFDWTCEGVDDGLVTSKQATASKRYSPRAFENPVGARNIFKDGFGDTLVESTIVEDGKSRLAGLYATALDELSAGRDVELSWEVEALGFDAPYTWKDLNGDGEQSEDEIGVLSVHYDIDDTEVVLDHDATLGADDMEVTRLAVSSFTQREWCQSEATQYAYHQSAGNVSWGRVEPGDWCYLPVVPDGAAGIVRFLASGAAGTDVEVGTYDTCTGVYSASNGAVADASGIALPAGFTTWRAEVDSRADAADYVIVPTVRLKASSPKVSSAVSAIFAAEDDPATDCDNSVRMRVTLESDGRIVFDRTKTGRNFLQGFTNAVEAVQTVKATNDVEAQRANLAYTTSVTRTTNFAKRDLALAAGFEPEASGTFWELLPEGVVADTSSVRAVGRSGSAGGTVGAVVVHEDWAGTGRTMLEVPVTWRPAVTWNYLKDGSRTVFGEEFGIAFDASMTWAAMGDWGDAPVCQAMYVTDSESLANAFGRAGEVPGETSAHTHSATAVRGAEAAFAAVGGEGPVAVYASVADPLGVDRAYATGLSKSVDVNGENRYSQGLSSPTAMGVVQDERNVWGGGTYSYRIHVENDEVTRLSGIVLADSLENYRPSGVDAGDGRFKGELVSVDISQLKAAGIDARVYYSTRDDMVFAEGETSSVDLTNTSVWSTERPAHVGAVAVDCSYGLDGKPFTLGTGASISVYLKMQAPMVSEVAEAAGVPSDEVVDSTLDDISKESASGGYHAYNNVAMVASKVSETGTTEAPQLIHQDYTKVGLKEQSVEVVKAWDDDSDRDGIRPDTVTVRLYENGADTGRSAELTAQNGWTARFGDLAGGPYTVVEDVPEGYSATYRRTVEGSTARWRVTNTHSPETVEVSGSKVWDDGSDSAGRRPAYVVLGVWGTPEGGSERLYRTFRVYAPEASEGDVPAVSWDFTVAGLKAYEGGRRVSYRVAEYTVPEAYVSEAALEDGSWHVTNTYMATGSIEVSKAVDGYGPEGATHGFRVLLWDRDGAPVTEPVELVCDGETSFYTPGDTFQVPSNGTASLPAVGEGWTYRVEETAGPGWTMVSSKNTSGKVRGGTASEVSVTNRYRATGNATLEATKTIVGGKRELRAGEFTFSARRVVDGEATGPTYRATNTADGTVTFSLPLSTEDVGKEVSWEVREVRGSASGIAYDTSVFRTTAEVSDDGLGHLVASDWTYAKTSVNPAVEMDGIAFVNSYSAWGNLNVEVGKTWPGWGNVFKALGADTDPRGLGFSSILPGGYWYGTWGRNLFDIELLDERGNMVADTMPETSTGVGSLGISASIGASQSTDGVWTPTYYISGLGDVDEETFFAPHKFYVREKVDPSVFTTDWAGQWVSDSTKAEAFAQAVRDNIVWDEHTEEIEVSFIDEGNSRIRVEVLSGDIKAEFENGFKDGSITVEKRTDGTGDANKEFRFHVEVEDGPDEVELEWPLTGTVTFDANGAMFGRHSTPTISMDYQADGNYGDSDETEIVSGPYLKNTGQEFLWWGDKEGNKIDLASVKPGETVYATWLDCSKSGNVKGESGTCWWGIGADGTLRVVPKNGTDGVLATSGGIATSPWYSYRTNVRTITSIGSIAFGSGPARGMFLYCSNLTDVSALATWDTSAVASMFEMFRECSNLVDVSPLAAWDTSAVTDMSGMFDGCSSLSDVSVLSSWDTSNVTNMTWMFSSCSSLVDASVLAPWDTSYVTDMSHMFEGCSSLADVSFLASWKMTKAGSQSDMFDGCSAVAKVRIPGTAVVSRGVIVATLKGLPSDVRGASWTKGLTTTTLNDILTKTSETDKAAVAGTWTRVGAKSLAAAMGTPSVASAASAMGLPAGEAEDGAVGFVEDEIQDAPAVRTSSDTVMSGTVGTDDAVAAWDLDGDGTLTIHGGDGVSIGTGDGVNMHPSWKDAEGNDPTLALHEQVRAICLDGSVNLVNGYGLFISFTNLEDISGLSSMDVSSCVTFRQMFQDCSSLKDVSPLASWRPGKGATGEVDLAYMFNRTPVTTLDALEGWFDVREAEAGSDAPQVNLNGTFGHCTALRDASALRFWKVAIANSSRAFTDTPALEVVGIGRWCASADSDDPAYGMWEWNGNDAVGRSLYQDNAMIGSGESTWVTDHGDEKRSQSGLQMGSWTESTTGIWTLVDDRKTINFDLNGGTGEAPAPIRFKWDDAAWGASITFPDPSGVTAPAGKVFSHWACVNGPDYITPKPGDTYNALDFMESTDEGSTFVAVWENAPITLKFLSADGSVAWSGEVDPEKGLTETPYCEPPAGQRLVAWAPEKSPESHIVSGRATGPIDTAWMDGASVTFTPVFENLPSTVTGKDGSYDFTLRPGQHVTLPGLPAGSSYRVWEETEAGWTLASAEGDLGTVMPGADVQATFTNAYRPTEATAQITARKEVVGGGASPSGWHFELLDPTGSVVATGVSGPTGDVSMTTPAMTYPGTYTYTVREAAEQPDKPADMSISCDDTTRTVTVDVTDDGTGRLVAYITYDGAGMTFTNVVEPGTIVVTKSAYNTTAGRPLDGTFRFTATHEDGTVEEFWLGDNERHEISAAHGERVVIAEEDVDDWVSAYANYEGRGFNKSDRRCVVEATGTSGKSVEVNYNNTYRASAATATISARKSVPTMAEVPSFAFALDYESMTNLDGSVGYNGVTYKGQNGMDQWLSPGYGKVETTNYEDGLVEFPSLVFSSPGIYIFDIHEVAGTSDAYTYDGAHHTATVTVTDGGRGRLSAEISYDGSPVPPTFTNTVATKAVEVEKRVVEGYHDAAGETFPMRISLGTVDASALEALRITAAEAASALTVDGEPYTAGEVFEVAAGQTVTVEGPAAVVDAIEAVTEDEVAGYTAEVSEEEVEGTRRFVVTNTYAASGTFSVGATKTLDGREPGDESFTFTLTDPDGNLAAKATNDASGAVTMDGLEVFEPGTYRYTLAEADDGRAGVVFDDRTVGVVVTATDAGSGVLSCEVSYDGSPEPPVFENTTGTPVAMPSTGGAGLPWAISACGAAAALLAARIRARRRRDR